MGSNIMTTELNKAHIETIAKAAKTWGGANKILVAALNVLRESGETGETVDNYRDTFYANAIASGAGVSLKAAELQISLKPYDFKKPETMTDKHRSPEAQRVFNAAKMAWSRGRDAAGFAPKKVVKRAAADKDEAGEPQTVEKLPLNTFAVAPVASAEELLQLMSTVATVLKRTLDGSSDKVTGDCGSILRGAITDMVNACGDAQAALDLANEPMAQAA